MKMQRIIHLVKVSLVHNSITLILFYLEAHPIVVASVGELLLLLIDVK